MSDSPDKKDLAKFFEVQDKELDFRFKELEYQYNDLQSNKEVILATINAEKEDRQDDRRFEEGESTKKYYSLIAILIIICIFIVILIYQGQATMVEKIVEIFVTAGLGAIAGYGFAKSKSK